MKEQSQNGRSSLLSHIPLVAKVALAFAAAIGGTAVATLPVAAEPKRDTAEYYLAYGKENRDKEIRLDVAFVKPVHWASPDPEIAFFHAMTIDARAKKPGGGILVMLPESEKKSFIKRYGMNREGFRTSTLHGILRTLPNRQRRGTGVYVVDYKGLLGDRIKDRIGKLTVINEAGGADAPPPEQGTPGSGDLLADDGAAVGETETVEGGKVVAPSTSKSAESLSAPDDGTRPYRLFRRPFMDPNSEPPLMGDEHPPFRRPIPQE